MISVEDGYRLAKHNMVGRYVAMGVESAEIKEIKPLSSIELQALPNFDNWLAYRLGFQPSLWAKGFVFLAQLVGHRASRGEWVWLHRNTSLAEARKWLDEDSPTNDRGSE